MLFLDLGPMIIKGTFLLDVDSPEDRFLKSNIEKLEEKKFFFPSLDFTIKDKKTYFFKINNLKFKDFSESDEYKLIKNFIFFFEEQVGSKIIGYYCGILKDDLEEKMKNLFNCELKKLGNINKLSIYGIDYIVKNIEKGFFYLPGQEIFNLVKVGHLEKVTEKKYIRFEHDFYPFIMANVLEGVSVYKVENKDYYTRVGGNGFGASTYWSLVSMICGYDDPEKAVEDAIKGNNELIDLSISDIYGGGYDTFGLDSSLIAASFGKLKHVEDMNDVNRQDISRSLMTLLCVTASQICGLIAKQEKIKNILIVGNAFEALEFMQMVQMCVSYYSDETSNAYFTPYSPFINLIGMILSI